jgi:hypothetical protein
VTTFAGWPGFGNWTAPGDCPHGPHRGPEGPNEDIAQCPTCLSPSWRMRPEGETYGEHLPDCSLEPRHEGRCKPGGDGHPPADVVRGYWNTRQPNEPLNRRPEQAADTGAPIHTKRRKPPPPPPGAEPPQLKRRKG